MDPIVYSYMQPPARKKRRRWPVVLGACVLALAVAGGAAAYIISRPAKAEVAVGSRAVVLDQEWTDFFRYPCNPTEEKAHIDEMLAGVQQLGADTVLWSPLTSNGYACFRDPTDTLTTSPEITDDDRWYQFLDPFDPLQYLIEQANEAGVAVALLATDAEGAALPYSAVEQCGQAIARQSRRSQLPVAARDYDPEAEALPYSTTQQLQSYRVHDPLTGEETTGQSAESQPTEAEAVAQATDAEDTTHFWRCDGNPDLLAAALQTEGTDSVILGEYTALSEDASDLETLAVWMDGSAAPDLTALWGDRALSQTLALTYPTDPTATLTTNNIFLMGTSDPSLPLTIAGGTIDGTQTLARNGSKGVWGTVVELVEGQNLFTIAQEGGDTLQITLTYQAPSYTPSQPINDGSVAAEEGQYLQIVSTAASALSDPGNDDSISQTLYEGAIAQVMDSYAFTRSNTATYAYKLPSGDWVLAKDCTLLEMVPEEGEEDAEDEEEPKADEDSENTEDTQEEDAGDAGEGEEREPDEDEEEKEVKLVSSVGDAAFTGLTAAYDEATRCTVLTFEGEGTPVIYHSWKDDLLSLVFYSAGFSGSLPDTDSFIRNIGMAELENGFVLNITCASGQLWGWNSEYTEDGGTKIYLKHTPTVSEAESGPLTGVTVLLDAGHGGEDNGAMGSAGLTAPCEKDVNLAEIMAAKYRLEQLGATVLLTRESDETVSLQQRLTALNEQRPDFFISLHHNSAALSADLNGHTGTEAYWFYTESANLAQNLLSGVTGTTGRKARGYYYDYYYVTRSNICPAVLLETGFMTNPGEYEDVSDPVTLLAEGGAVANAVLQCVQQGVVPYSAE